MAEVREELEQCKGREGQLNSKIAIQQDEIENLQEEIDELTK